MIKISLYERAGIFYLPTIGRSPDGIYWEMDPVLKVVRSVDTDVPAEVLSRFRQENPDVTLDQVHPFRTGSAMRKALGVRSQKQLDAAASVWAFRIDGDSIIIHSRVLPKTSVERTTLTGQNALFEFIRSVWLGSSIQ